MQIIRKIAFFLQSKEVQYGIAAMLVAANVFIWSNTVSVYQEDKADIFIVLDDITREVALSFRIIEMSLQKPVDELPMPVYGIAVDDIDDTWGAARQEGRTHEGTDIFAARGTPVFSATEGYVVRQNIGTRGGINIMVVGPGGIRYYYAHLDRVASGMKRGIYVTPDTVLGFVGNSGNAEETPPHLHFGIYPARWDAINPYPFLVDRWDEE